jgi:hypothetical protein
VGVPRELPDAWVHVSPVEHGHAIAIGAQVAADARVLLIAVDNGNIIGRLLVRVSVLQDLEDASREVIPAARCPAEAEAHARDGAGQAGGLLHVIEASKELCNGGNGAR